MLKKIWAYISYLGLDSDEKNLQSRTVILCNQVNASILFITIFAVIFLKIDASMHGRQIGIGTYRVVFYSLVGLTGLILNRFRFVLLSKLTAIFLGPFVLLVLPTLTGFVEPQSYVYYSLIFIACSVLPQLILIPGKDRALFIISMVYYFILFMTNELLLRQFDNQNVETWEFIKKFIAEYKLVQICFYLFVNLSVYYIRRLNTKFEEELNIKNHLLSEQSEELKAINHELDEQNEELKTALSQLKFQAKHLSETNVLLEERQVEVFAQNEEIKRQAAELSSLNATKDKFFNIIAHDLKNPFQAINGFAYLFQKRFDVLGDEKKREFIKNIEKSSKSASDLLENLLIWSRAQTNSIEFNPKKRDIFEIIEETLNLLELNAQRKKIVMENHVEKGTFAFFDINMITTVIRNLVNNAIKFSKESGKVILQTKHIDNSLEVSVEDTGVGMNKMTIEKLFKIDQEYTELGTAGESGTGLGLIICKEFVERNNGEIHVESELGIGSRFIFTLPLKK